MSKKPTEKPQKEPPQSQWQRYVDRKRQLESKPLSPKEYEAEILKIADELGV